MLKPTFLSRKIREPRFKRVLLLATVLLLVGAVCGCRMLKFYGQAIKGQYQLFANRTPVEEVIRNDKTSSELRRQLELVQQLRRFARDELDLPVDGHYSSYVDVGRPFVVWNVQAAPEFSLEPKTWWYPMVGRLEYRGYFSEAGAEETAARLRRQGFDVFVGGVTAYSTLGWFKDPVLNTFVHRQESELAEVIFHELAHQRVFARGDTDFNEAFATVVGEESARRWLRSQAKTNALADYETLLARNAQFVRLVLRTRHQLETLYGDVRDEDGKLKAAHELPAPADTLRQEKERVFARMLEEYGLLKAEWGDFDDYDGWFSRELNNAKLNTIANYYDYVPGFVALLHMKDGDLAQFYDAAEELANKPQEERHEWLRTFAQLDSKLEESSPRQGEASP